MRYAHGRILIFAKAPVPGYAKTRLIPVLGNQGAADLQEKLIRRTLGMAVESYLAPIQLWTCGTDAQLSFDAYRSVIHGEVQLQCGADLGARMQHAFEETLRVAEFAVLIGTDCPVLDGDYLEQACAALTAGCDAVLGPAEDGGYVLIGLRRCHAHLFENIPWGTAEVLAQTRQRLAELPWSVRELPTLWDLDRPEDYDRLMTLG